MKTLNLIIIILALVSKSIFAQYNLSPDAPLNPVPIKFHKDHFFLKGDIKKQSFEFWGLYLEYKFNEQGYLIYEPIIGELTYNRNGKLTSSIAETGKSIDFFTDKKNRPVKKIYSDGTVYKYEYDKKGNLIKEYTNYKSDKIYLSYKYKYDKKNRITEIKRFDSDGNIKSTEKYAYQKEGDFLKITKTTDTETFINYYKNGHYCGKKPQDIKLDKKGNPVSDGADTNYKYTYFSDNNTIADCISGNCKDGWGTCTYDNGKYIGFWKNGLKHGYGEYYWNTGSSYSGQWTKDKITGFGIYLENDNYIQGEFLNGKLNGLGVIKKGDNWEQGIYSENTPVNSYSFIKTGNTTGCAAGDCNEKYGKYVWDNGDSYIGFWKNGNIHMGIYNFSDGDMYIGYFNPSGQFDNFGFYYFKSGTYYVGEWKSGKYHGTGYLKKSSGEEQQGVWEAGEFIKSLE